MIAAIEGGWTAGTLFSVPFLVIMLIIGVGIGIYILLDDFLFGAAWIAGVVASIVFLGVLGMWPFEKEYHYWQPTSGVVEQVDRRLVADGEGMSEKVVIRFEGDAQQYGIEDTRAALLKPGDEATLLCKRAHQWGPSADGYDCRWGEGA